MTFEVGKCFWGIIVRLSDLALRPTAFTPYWRQDCVLIIPLSLSHTHIHTRSLTLPDRQQPSILSTCLWGFALLPLSLADPLSLPHHIVLAIYIPIFPVASRDKTITPTLSD